MSNRGKRDRIVIGLCLFFIVMASTVEFWWLRHTGDLAVQHGWLGAAFRFYGGGDRGYYDQVSRFEIALETFHVAVTQFLYVVLVAAILRDWRLRFPLQLCLGSYVAYSVTLYFMAKHMTGYVQTPVHNLASMLLLIVPNLPWLLGNLYLALDAGAEITRAVARREAAS